MQKRGLAFERAVRKRLSEECKWLGLIQPKSGTIRDIRGSHHLPDIWIPCRPNILLFEAKLTFTLAGIEQLFRYAPLLSNIYQQPVVCILVCKNLSPDAVGFPAIRSVREAYAQGSEGPYVWHLPFPKELN